MKLSLSPYVFLAILHTGIAFASDTNAPLKGLIGGLNGSGAYASFVDESGNLTPLNLGITNGRIGAAGLSSSSVAINPAGVGIIVGQNGNAAYASFVGPGTQVNPLNLGVSSGYMINSAINSSSLALISGVSFAAGPTSGAIAPTGIGYAAFATPDGNVEPLFLDMAGTVWFSAINDPGLGLIVGNEGTWAVNSTPYAAFVTPGSIPVPLNFGTSNPGGVLYTCDINDSGVGLIGGVITPSAGSGLTGSAYAAFVTADGNITQINLPVTSSGPAGINAVAINDAGQGIIAGHINSTRNMYAAFVFAEQTSPQPILGLPATNASNLECADINSSGAAVIGGIIGGVNTPYAALIAPNGTLTPLNLNIPYGNIVDAEISDTGVALIGGSTTSDSGGSNRAPYAALVAPGGQISVLNLGFSSGSINGVSVDLLATPSSIGSNWGAFNSQLAATYALNSHMTGKYRLAAPANNPDISFVASADDNLPINEVNSSTVNMSSQNPNMLWVSPFGNYVREQASGPNPSVSNSIGGFLVGYDYSYSDLMFGAATGYSYNYLGFGANTGHGSIQNEVVTFYGSYEKNHLLVNFALWGGLYQWYNKRFTLGTIPSKSFTQGWTFTPHFEIAFPFNVGNTTPVSLEPFAMVDYVSNWQGGYTEKGVSGLNLVMSKHYSSLLRSEAGLRLSEEWDVNQGKFVFLQKLSYVNQAPFHFNTVTTSFVGSASTFSVATGTSTVQNLGALELRGSFLPQNDRYPYFTIGVQAEAGTSYQSYFGNIEIGKSF